MDHPLITLLPPSPSVPTDHHVSSSGAIALDTSAKPVYFRNPWPSYRTASLNDAWLAYQRGAAIALPRARTPGPSRTASSVRLNEEEYLDSGSDETDEDHHVDSAMFKAARTAAVHGYLINRQPYIPTKFSTYRAEDEEDDWRDPPVVVVQPNWGGEAGKERVTWLGHAGVLVQVPWKKKGKGKGDDGREGMCGLLFDPIFSYRCSPSQYVGPARYLEPPCQIKELPPIHACFISHDHYDHLDYYSILDLWKYHQTTIHFFVPSGLKAWFEASRVPSARITELDWWHEALLSFPPPSSAFSSATTPPEPSLHYPPPEATELSIDPTSTLNLKIAFTPAQHRSGRGVFDHMTTLWGSWCVGVVERADESKAGARGMREDWEGFKVFFGGDTGFRYATAPTSDPTSICPAFSSISALYSPFSLALLPLSTGSSLPFLRTLLSLSLDQYTLTSSLHCSPADSLEIHCILKSRRTLGIHWGTFCDEQEARGTRVEFGRVRRELRVGGVWEWEGSRVAEGERQEDSRGAFVVCDVGETLVFP